MDRGMMGGKALLYLNAWGSRWLFQCEMYTPLLDNPRSSSCQAPRPAMTPGAFRLFYLLSMVHEASPWGSLRGGPRGRA